MTITDLRYIIDDAIYDLSSSISGAALLASCATMMMVMGIFLLASVGALWALPVIVAFGFAVALIQWDVQIQVRRPVVRVHVDINPPTLQYGYAA